MFTPNKPISPEIKLEIEVLNLAWRLFQDEHQGRLQWIDAGKALQQRYFEKAR